MTLICSGSLAYDRLLSYSGVFADSIIADKLNMLNVSYVADQLKVAYGGTAGNIAYNLGLLGEKPLIVSSLGDDPDGGDYLRRIGSWGFPLTTVKVQPGYMTAGCTIATDLNNNQFTFFHPGAMMAPSGFDPAELPQPYESHLAIVSPGGPQDMKSLCAAYHRLGLRFIFDPGQQIPLLSPEELAEMLEGAFIFICNEYEFELYKKKTGLSTDELFCRTEAIIVTKGEKGSELLVPGRGSQHISPVPVKQVANPTGAGDAYRAGLMKGLARREHLVTACRLGATVAAFCVESEGGPQHQTFSPAQVMARHASAFKEQINL
jgi:Sugar kinases, ribokinase family